jgi:glutamate dehydrogenase
MVKNAVIVPVGSKGGFVLKQAPAPAARSRAFLAEGIACYKTFMRGLLDITDNLVGGALVPPPHVVRHDGDDPYLVVAADKGTATFSDIANGVAGEYGFWLGDAFASGGSVGYDHKAMGITARGAWEAVKRHFREMGIDTRPPTSPWSASATCRATCSATACCCRAHIRCSRPSTTATSSSTRTRTRPRASPSASACSTCRARRWAGLRPELISPGGGVFDSRGQVDRRCSRDARRRCSASTARRGDARRRADAAILKAPVDLLWFGGIGTYVKARRRDHAEVGDKANDAIRINGGHLRPGRGRGRQPRRDPARAASSMRAQAADASTPTPSTTRPASTPPTTRSTSRSCSARLARAAAS